MEEGLRNTEAFVALTDNSETNILACLAAKRMGVTKTVAEVENIDYISMAESLDIGTVINKKMIAASHIYQMMLDADVSNVKCLTFANADVAEFTVKNRFPYYQMRCQRRRITQRGNQSADSSAMAKVYW